MIVLTNLGKSFGQQNLFSGVDLQLTAGNRYGVVGANGSGKSTLLSVLAGEEGPSDGSVSIPRRTRLGLLRQDHFGFEQVPILNVAMQGRWELWQAMEEKETLLAQDDDLFDGERFAELEEIVQDQGGYTLEAEAGEILEGLGIPAPIHREPISTLSGGFKLRVLLAQVLVARPDALLLDEPTNHLDILSIRWLEKFLGDYDGCGILVSHDHRFLDNVCTHILDVDYETISLYRGNYTDFETAKKEDRERREAEIEKQEREIADLQAFADRFRAKATKARQAQSKLKQMERIVIEPLPRSSRRYPVFRFDQCRPSGKIAVEAKGLSRAYDDNQVLSGVSLQVPRGDRLAIIGPNGIGKSTLLKILVDRLEPDEGRVEWGYETHPGYFPQDPGSLLGDPKRTVESWLWDACPGEPVGFVRGKLAKVLFSGEDVQKRIRSLSGGEASRLLFCRLGILQPNVLVLDEPTNHLDLEAIEALVVALKEFEGTLVFVSHDRWFVSELATRILEITPNGILDFPGTYDEYLESCGDDHLDGEQVDLRVRREKRVEKARRKSAAPGKRRARNRELTTRRRALEKELEAVTGEVEEAEARVHAINELFADPGFFARTPHAEVRKLENEQKERAARAQELMGRWEELENELENNAREAAALKED